MKKRKKINGVRVAIGAAAICCFLCLWAFATREGTTLGKLMPGPIEVFTHLIETTYTKVGPMTIWGHMFNSLRRVLVGLPLLPQQGYYWDWLWVGTVRWKPSSAPSSNC